MRARCVHIGDGLVKDFSVLLALLRAIRRQLALIRRRVIAVR